MKGVHPSFKPYIPMSDFARLLNDQDLVDHFLNTVLEADKKKFKNIAYGIITCEKGTIDGLLYPTSKSTKFRDRKYRTENERLKLGKQIVDELFKLPLLAKDDHIKLKKGGAKPKNLKSKSNAYILIGLPASGKSTIAMDIANQYGAMILDSDFAKRKLPEFSRYQWGASIVHDESSTIIFGDNLNIYEPLIKKAVQAKYNIVIPKIGAGHEEILRYCEDLKLNKYKVHLTLVSLPKEKATLRALGRYKSTKRYVPLSLIFDVYSERPMITYFILKNKLRTKFDSFGIINTDVPIGKDPVCTDLVGNNPAKLYKYSPKLLI